MYTGYYFKIQDIKEIMNASDYSRYFRIAQEHYSGKKANLYHRMELFLDKAYDDQTNSILMKSIENTFFPNVHCHVFLSHSSKDEKCALALAGYLWEKCNVEVFIDSMLWEFCDDLLEVLDNRYACTDGHTYDYDSRNITTAQIHVLVNMALAKMINSTECFVFLDSTNSRAFRECISSEETASPWLYSELLISEIIQKRPPESHRQFVNESFSHSDIDSMPSFIYNAALSKLYHLTSEELDSVASQISDEEDNRAESFLDCLYATTGKYTA